MTTPNSNVTHLDALLVLEDGRAFRGRGIGAPGPAFGEVVFNTSMTGYQEIATDPSYRGQLVALTASQIGNYGVTPQDSQTPERDRAQLAGFVLRQLAPAASNHRATGDLDRWLERQGVAAIHELDTRALTRHLRAAGAMRGGVFRFASEAELPAAGTPELDALVEQVRAQPSMEGRDLASEAGTRERYTLPAEGEHAQQPRYRVALVDFGVKRGILRGLTSRGLEVDVFPAATTAEELLASKPDGLVLSNGPGDPAALEQGIALARALIGQAPLLGICLGHQLSALALGGRTVKLPFGHHGGNHPVRDLRSGELWITAQNHGFAVDVDSLPAGAEATHINLYDGTLEGFSLAAKKLLAVQFHPEAGPGPSDAQPVFDRYVELLDAESPNR